MEKDDCKVIMANNIKRYMEMAGISNKQLCAALGFKYPMQINTVYAITLKTPADRTENDKS